MGMIRTTTTSALHGFLSDIQAKLQGAASLEDGARLCVNELWQHFADSLVLVRVYASVPFDELPTEERRFVEALVSSAGVRPSLRDKTPVLTLLGTRGVERDWNDRRRSRGHVGIPLLSASFIEGIPMLARLFRDVGVESRWFEGLPTITDDATGSRFAKVFHVEDAASSVDDLGRKIIPAQDFVATQHVRTVFGMGGAYIAGSTLLSLLFFSREALERPVVERFLPIVSALKSGTTRAVSQRRIFAS